jgi:hypothetical protein
MNNMHKYENYLISLNLHFKIYDYLNNAKIYKLNNKSIFIYKIMQCLLIETNNYKSEILSFNIHYDEIIKLTNNLLKKEIRKQKLKLFNPKVS